MISDFKKHLIASLNENIRADGRKCEDIREISVETDVSKTAEGSARVTFGETEVMAGVKLGLGEPFPDKPDEGSIMVNVELLPLSNKDFVAGPPDIQAIELSRVIDRGIRESKAIDFKNLVIRKGEKCWMLQVDICTINDAGNLLDACYLAALAALKTTYFPEYDNEQVNYKVKTDQKIELRKMPISVTVSKIGSALVVDPTSEEEEHIDARLTVAMNQDDTICSLQKGGAIALTTEEIEQMVELAQSKSKEVREKINF